MSWYNLKAENTRLRKELKRVNRENSELLLDAAQREIINNYHFNSLKSCEESIKIKNKKIESLDKELRDETLAKEIAIKEFNNFVKNHKLNIILDKPW